MDAPKNKRYHSKSHQSSSLKKFYEESVTSGPEL